MRILGIETSCDETAMALLDSKTTRDGNTPEMPGPPDILGQALFSQIDLHRPFGGVVPELAARDHIVRLIPILEKTLGKHDLNSIDSIAYTAGPGLISPLLTGAVFAHALAEALGCPAIGVHHMEGHLLSPRLASPAPPFPFVALLVSGGHTQLFLVDRPGSYRLLGDTMDDAAGEAFDKTAKLLGLNYPGGPEIERLAAHGIAGRYTLPRPMLKQANLDFSFSGLKTHAAQLFQKLQNTSGNHTSDGDGDAAGDAQDGERAEHAGQARDQMRADFALAFEDAITDTLAIKCQRALEQTDTQALVVAGGVSANRRLREKLGMLDRNGITTFFPPPGLCTDNGVMIAYAGLARLQNGDAPSPVPEVRPRWELTGWSKGA